MASTPSMLTGHLAHDLLHTLADLDKGDKLLGISSLLRTTVSTTETSVKHPIGLAAAIVLQWLFVYLIRHLVLRTAGTLMVETRTRDRHDRDTHKFSNHANLGYLRHALASPRRLRRDIVLGVTYNILSLLLVNLLTSISSSLTWEILTQVIVDLLLANLHLRWTCVILAYRKPMQTRMASFPRRDMILPSILHVLAQQATTQIPVYISKTISAPYSNSLGGIAFADTIVLIVAFGLRLLALYPTLAARIYMELRLVDTKKTTEKVSTDRERTLGLESQAYVETVRLCFRRTALGYGLLHLQMVSALVALELIMTPVLYRVVF